MTKSICFALPLLATIVALCSTANADLINVVTIHSGGLATAFGADSDQWSESTWGSNTASASGSDPGPPSGAHTASAAATLTRSLNTIAISGNANAMAETDLFSGNADFANSTASVLFSTSIPVDFLLTLAESEPGLGGVRRFSDSQNVLSPGLRTTLAPGSYEFYGNAGAFVQSAGESQSQSFSATLTASAVPEPSSAISLAVCALCFGFRRTRR